MMAANQIEAVYINDSRKRATELDSFAHSLKEKRNRTSSFKTVTFASAKGNNFE